MPKKPRAKFTKEQRDLYVQQNRYPKRTDLTNNADFRGVTGDVQAGRQGLAIRMESRPEYLAKQRGQTAATLDRKTPATMAPHHRTGIQDQTAFMEGLTPKQAAKRRSTMAQGGLHIGNVEANLESLYDGDLSKAGRAQGIFSSDHRDVHQQSENLRKRYGIKTNKNDRSLDTYHGKPIKDLPNNLRRDLQIQLGLADEQIINSIQKGRFDAIKRAYPKLPYDQLKKLIIEMPDKVANLSTKVKPKGVNLNGIMPFADYIPAFDEMTGGHLDKGIQKGVNWVRSQLGIAANPIRNNYDS